MHLPPGKVPPGTLSALLAHLPSGDPGVLVGPGPGQDAAVIDLGEQLLVVASDPVTFVTEQLGWYAVQLNANDVACMGARPRWFLAVVLVPPRLAEEEWLEGVFAELGSACRELGVQVVGGHTEVTPGLETPIVSGCMFGLTTRRDLVDKARVQPGDRLVLVRPIAIEGTAILARERAEELCPVLGAERLGVAQGFIRNPGIGVSALALEIAAMEGITALHDPTEGGLYGGLAELAAAAGVGLRIDLERVPVHAETRRICQYFGIDPYGLIASGSLIVAARPDAARRLLRWLAERNVVAAEIGVVAPAEEGLQLVGWGEKRPLRPPQRDELTRVIG
jgi:hydrogenase maturation factor